MPVSKDTLGLRVAIGAAIDEYFNVAKGGAWNALAVLEVGTEMCGEMIAGMPRDTHEQALQVLQDNIADLVAAHVAAGIEEFGALEEGDDFKKTVN